MMKLKVRISKEHIKRNQKHYIIFSTLLVLSFFLIATALIVDTVRPSVRVSADTDTLQKEEAKKMRTAQEAIIRDLKKEIKLPADEEPIFATVAQKEQLQKQNFFRKSQNGDKVLLYPKHQRVILYRPSTKKIIAVSKLQYEGSTEVTPTVSSSPPPQIEEEQTNL